MLRAVSNKTYGLQFFLDEILSELNHLVNTVRPARQISVIRHEQVVKIIDSVMQRSNFSMDGISSSMNIQDSVVPKAQLRLTISTRKTFD